MAVWSEIKHQELGKNYRLEPEYYQPFYLEAYSKIKSCGLPISKLGTLCKKVTDGSHITPDYQGEGVPFLMIRNVHEENISFEDTKFITEKLDLQLKHCKPKAGDILLSKVGSIGISAVVQNDAPDFNIFVSLAVIKDIEINPYYLSTFLNSYYGKVQCFREAKGISQPDLHLEEIRDFLVPLPDDAFQREIESTVFESIKERRKSESLYQEAEALLLHELGLDALDLSDEITYERNFDEVAQAGRLDAQYFHPEKREVQDALAKMTGLTVGEHFSAVNDLINPQSKENQKDKDKKVQNYDLDEALQFFLDDIEPMNLVDLGSAKKAFQKGDVVVSRLRSYLKEIAIVKSSNLCVGSSEYIVLRNNNSIISSELLTVYLRSSVVQKILKWSQDGSNHPRFKETELLAIKIPDKLISAQSEIIKLLNDSINAITQAKQLLEDAKRRVEDMILGA